MDTWLATRYCTWLATGYRTGLATESYTVISTVYSTGCATNKVQDSLLALCIVQAGPLDSVQNLPL